jgi:hypothetical protein
MFCKIWPEVKSGTDLPPPGGGYPGRLETKVGIYAELYANTDNHLAPLADDYLKFSIELSALIWENLRPILC